MSINGQIDEWGDEFSEESLQVKIAQMGKGEKKQTDDNKRKRNREAKNEEILKVGLALVHNE